MTIALALCLSVIGTAQAAAATAEGYNTARRDSILNVISGAKIPSKKASILKFGAKGDGKKDCLPAFKKAMAVSKKQGGLHIVVPAGTY